MIRNLLSSSAQLSIETIKEKTCVKYMWNPPVFDNMKEQDWVAAANEQESLLEERNNNNKKVKIRTEELIETLNKM